MLDNSNISSLKAHSIKIDNTAHNVANVNTPNFKPIDTILHEDSPAGVTASTRVNNDSYGTDLAKEITDLKVFEAGYTTQLQVMKVHDRLTGELLNLLG